MRKRHPRHSSAGVSLVSVMMAVAFLGVLTVILSGFMTNTFMSMKRFEQSADLLDLRRIMRLKINCFNTKAANSNWSSCQTVPPPSASARQQGRDAGNNIVISSNPSPNNVTVIGDYKLVLRCVKPTAVTSPVTLWLEVSRKSDGTVLADNLFKSVPFTCAR